MLLENDKNWIEQQIQVRTDALVEQFSQVIKSRDTRVRTLTDKVQELQAKLQALETEIQAWLVLVANKEITGRRSDLGGRANRMMAIASWSLFEYQ